MNFKAVSLFHSAPVTCFTDYIDFSIKSLVDDCEQHDFFIGSMFGLELL